VKSQSRGGAQTHWGESFAKGGGRGRCNRLMFRKKRSSPKSDKIIRWLKKRKIYRGPGWGRGRELRCEKGMRIRKRRSTHFGDAQEKRPVSDKNSQKGGGGDPSLEDQAKRRTTQPPKVKTKKKLHPWSTNRKVRIVRRRDIGEQKEYNHCVEKNVKKINSWVEIQGLSVIGVHGESGVVKGTQKAF